MNHGERLEEVWSSKPNRVDWRGLELAIRGVLGEFKQGSLVEHETLLLIDKYLAAFTRRGNTLEGH